MQGEMALLLSPIPSFSSPLSPYHSLSMAISAHPFSRLSRKNPSLKPRSFNGVWFHTPVSFGERVNVIVQASSDMDATNTDKDTPPEASGEVVSVENLPLESKQQMILEQRQKMKLAKKIRLRRKRLLRKRKMRKKGRWPPSKMKKLKNV